MEGPARKGMKREDMRAAEYGLSGSPVLTEGLVLI